VINLVDKSSLYNSLKGIVGSENVTDNETIMEAYTATTFRPAPRDTMIVFTDAVKPKKPDFIVRVGSTEEIQQIVRLANQYKLPVIPMAGLTSQYAEAVPTMGGIMIDLNRMRKIELDEE